METDQNMNKKQGMINQVKKTYKNITEEQALLQFNMAWNGLAPETGPFSKIGKITNQKAPGKIYQQIKTDITQWSKVTKTKTLPEETKQRLKTNLLKKAYDYSRYSKLVKKLTPQQIKQYQEFTKQINTILSNQTPNKKQKQWIKKTLLKDIKDSEVTEQAKLMKDFGLI